MFKKTLKIVLIITVVIFTFSLCLPNAYAISDGEGPYVIKITQKDEDGNPIKGGKYQIIKTHKIEKDKEVKLEEPEIVKIENSDHNGLFTIDGEISVTIPDNYNKGIYEIVQKERVNGYVGIKSESVFEFPKIKDGEYSSSQQYNLDLKMSKTKLGFGIQLFSENENSEMGNLNSNATLKIVKINDFNGNKVEDFKPIIVKYNEKTGEEVSNIIKDLEEGKYELSFNSLERENLALPQGKVKFNIKYKESENTIILDNIEYNKLDAGFVFEDLILRVFLYKDISVTSELIGLKDKFLFSGETGILNIKINKPLMADNFDKFYVYIPKENSNIKITDVDKAIDMDTYFVVEGNFDGPLNINAKYEALKDTDNIEYKVKIELKKGDITYTKEYNPFDKIAVNSGVYTANFKLSTGLFKNEKYLPKGTFTVYNLSGDIAKDINGKELKDIKSVDGILTVSGLKIGKYSISYKDDSGKIYNTDKFTIFNIGKNTSTNQGNFTYINEEITFVTKAYHNIKAGMLISGLSLFLVAIYIAKKKKL